MTDVEAFVARVAGELCPVQPPSGDPLASAEWDSLLLEQLIAEVEDHFMVLLDPEDVARAHLRDVPTFSAAVERRLAAWDA